MNLHAIVTGSRYPDIILWVKNGQHVGPSRGVRCRNEDARSHSHHTCADAILFETNMVTEGSINCECSRPRCEVDRQGNAQSHYIMYDRNRTTRYVCEYCLADNCPVMPE